MIGQAAEALHVLGKSTQALDAARDQVVFEWLEPAERKAAVEADSDFTGSIRAATMEHVAGVDQRATASHDGLGDFFGLCLSLWVPSVASGHDDGRTIVLGEVCERDVHADQEFGPRLWVVEPRVRISMEHLFDFAAAEHHQLSRTEPHSMAMGLQEMFAHGLEQRMRQDICQAEGAVRESVKALGSAAKEFVTDLIGRFRVAPIDGFEMGRHVADQLIDPADIQEWKRFLRCAGTSGQESSGFEKKWCRVLATRS